MTEGLASESGQEAVTQRARPDQEEAVATRDPPEDPTPDEKIQKAVITDLTEWFEQAVAAGEFEDETGPYAAPELDALETDFFDFSYLEGRREVERYWVNEPFAYVSILYDEERKTYSYTVTEPMLDEFEEYVRRDLVQSIRSSLMYRDISEGDRTRREIFVDEVTDIVEDQAATVDPISIQKIQYHLIRDFVDYARIDPIMRDSAIEDISCDGADVPVFVYHDQYRDLRSNVTFDSQRLNSLVVRLAQKANKHLSVSDPLIDASLPNGSRIQLTLDGDIVSRGSNFTIRKFSDVPFTPVDLAASNTFSIEQLAYLWLCIENNRSLLFAGGTGSGKTTSLNAVSFFIPPDSKVVTIEDTREISLPHDNWIQSLTRDALGDRGEIGTYELLQASLRQRPEYLLVGEIRTEERVAMTFFQAISTGHTCYSTVHADSVDGALSRLQHAPLSVPTQMVRELDILSIQKQQFVDGQRVRRNQSIAELTASGDMDIEPNHIFTRDAAADTHEKVGDSTVLDDIADLRGWTQAELDRQLQVRQQVLQYLLDEDIREYLQVAAVIHTFQNDPDYIVDRIEAGELDAGALAGGQR